MAIAVVVSALFGLALGFRFGLAWERTSDREMVAWDRGCSACRCSRPRPCDSDVGGVR